MTTFLDAGTSTFNAVGSDQFNQFNYDTPMESDFSIVRGQLPSPPPVFNDAPVGLLSRYFTGRQAELEQISHAFSRPRRNIPLRCVLFGDQGVGKSQLTYKWAKSTFDAGQNMYVIWMSATSIEKLDQGFSKILHLINHQDRFRSEQTVRLTAARRWLEEIDSGNWLLVIDNVFPDVVKFLHEHLPRQNGRGSILFTTRTKNLAVDLADAAQERHEIIRVPIPSIQDGVELFLSHFRDFELDIPFDKTQRIVQSVGCLPLAISHAAAYMKQSASTVDEMLALHESKNKIHAISWKNTFSEYEHQSVAATFENQLEDLERNCPNASSLMKVLAYLDPESIPLDMLLAGATSVLKSRNPTSAHSLAPAPRKAQSIVQKIKNKVLRRGDNKGKGRADEEDAIPMKLDSLLAMVQSPIELRNAIMELQMRALISYHDSTHSTLHIHDLIRLVVLEKTRTDAEQRRWFECAVEVACGAFNQIDDPGSPACWPQCEALMPHIQSLTARQEISREAKTKLLIANSNIGWYLRSRGRYGDAEQLLVQVLVDEEELLGFEDLRTQETTHHLAVVYREQGRYGEAEALLQRVLRSEKKLLGEDHVKTLTTMYELADVYKSQQRFAESEELLEKVLQTREKQIGPEHIQTLYTKDMLATIYRLQNRYDEAETLFKHVLQIMEKLHGPDHVETARTVNNLALVYLAQRRYSDAEELFERGLRILEKELGSMHPNTLLTKDNLGLVYKSQGRYDDAETLLVHVLACREEVLGISHPDTQCTADVLASVYEKLGRLEDAARIRR